MSSSVIELKQSNRLLSNTERSQKKAFLNSLPPQWQIEVTSRCNLRCTSCARTVYDERQNPTGDITSETLNAIIPFLPAAESIVIGGYGEPLLYKNLSDLLNVAQQAQCRIAIITNGTQIDSEIASVINENHVSEIVISIDAVDPIKLLGLRGIQLDSLRKNVAILKNAAPKCRTIYQMTLGIHNLAEVDPLIRLASEDGCDLRVNHLKAYTALLSEAPLFKYKEQARIVFEQSQSLADSLNVKLSLPLLEGTVPCLQPFELLSVRHDGTVQGCCSAMFNADVPHLILGKLPSDDAAKLWNHPLMLSARNAAYGLEPWPESCQNCAFRNFLFESHQRILNG